MRPLHIVDREECYALHVLLILLQLLQKGDEIVLVREMHQRVVP